MLEPTEIDGTVSCSGVRATSISVFSIIPIAGTITMNHAKYRTVAICPTRIHGFSTCSDPTRISTIKSATRIQNAHRISGRN